jgi:predicted nucleic acid-binding protein
MRGLTLVRLDEPLLDRAAELEPLGLRSLDALHLAAALTVGPDLGVFLTYDLRLAEAATNAGLVVDSPA